MLIKRFLAAALLPALIGAGTARAQDQGDPLAGRRLAEAWCVNCHALDSSRQAVATGAPAFSAVAANKALTPLALRAFLQTPHQRMPDLNLSNNELDDLIAFVLSQRKH